MPIITTKEHQRALYILCSKGKHKFRENSFGITWCVICGLLSTSTQPQKILLPSEKLTIIK